MSNFYISDTHFGHSNIIRHCNRPFVNADEMDEVLIKNWNSVVTNRDTVYILGDFAFSKGIKQPSEYLRELNGNKIMILGNHDYDIAKCGYKYSSLLNGIYTYLETWDTVGISKHKLVLSHYPMAEWNGMFRDSIHLYGHIHNNVENATYSIMKTRENAYNVGADILGFAPRTLREVIECNMRFNATN